MTDTIYEGAADAILKGDAVKAAEVAKQGIEEGIDPVVLLNSGFIPGIQKVGELFGTGKLFLPELMLSSGAMQAATDIINEKIPGGSGKEKGRFLIGTVQGDVHDIGKTIVVSLLKANGFEVKDLGRDVPVDRFINEAEKWRADIIGTSALLTTTMEQQKLLELALQKAGLREKYKTIVGGAPVTQRWAKRIGADAFAENATEGVRLAAVLMQKK
jgi:trimethylamine corrinoid protein